MLSVFFYLPKQFSSGSNARWPFLKYKMIISRRSMRIFNANCEVLINVPSLCSPKGFISLSIHFPYYVRIPDFLFCQISSPSTNLFPPHHLFTHPSPCLHFFQLPSLSPSRFCYRCTGLIDVALCFRSRVDEEGALSSGVDLFSALILIRISLTWLTWPARRNHSLSAKWLLM